MPTLVPDNDYFVDILVDNESRPLLQPTLNYLATHNYTRCSPVQQICIPLFLSKKDVAVEACTGSGKTLAYLIPAIEILYERLTKQESIDLPFGNFKGFAVGCLIIAPTRELVEQIHEVAKPLMDSFNQSNTSTLIYSKTIFKNKSADVDANSLLAAALTGKNKKSLGILIATPGRLSSHCTNKTTSGVLINHHFTFKPLEVLILDEADRLYSDVNYEIQMDQCLTKLPLQRRTGVFSATLSEQLKTITKRLKMRDPAFIQVKVVPAVMKAEPKFNQEDADSDSDVEETPGPNTYDSPTGLRNVLIWAEDTQKYLIMFKALNKLLLDDPSDKAIIFCSTCAAVEHLHTLIEEAFMPNFRDKKFPNYINPEFDTIEFFKIHGQMIKGRRSASVRKFASCQTRAVLIASDVVARGIDFKNVRLIIQMDPPKSGEIFFHRSGRTARAGKSGISIILATEAQKLFKPYLETQGVTLELPEGNSALLDTPIPYGNPNIISCPIQGSVEFKDFEILDPQILPDPDKSCPDQPVYQMMLNYLKLCNCRDRKYLELAKSAFVGAVKAYTESRLSYVMPVQNLDFGLLANSLGLPKIPRVKEILGHNIPSFRADNAEAFKNTQFLDPALQDKFNDKLANSTAKRAQRTDANKVRQLKEDKAKKIHLWPSARKKKKRANDLNEIADMERENKLAKLCKRGRLDYDEFLEKTKYSKVTKDSAGSQRWV